MRWKHTKHTDHPCAACAERQRWARNPIGRLGTLLMRLGNWLGGDLIAHNTMGRR